MARSSWDSPTISKPLTVEAATPAGADHSLALLEDGSARAWGDNTLGQLDSPVPESSPVPVPVQGPMGPLAGLRALRAGGYHTLLEDGGGRLSACGMNVFGQLGDWAFADSAVPRAVVSKVRLGGP